MPELRKDPIVGRWVIIASERAKRPREVRPPEAPPTMGICPFCPGQEDKTPPEIMAYRDATGWSLRVFPNRFPALVIEGDLQREGDGIYDHMNGVGAHEVLVETPDHDRRFADLSLAQAQLVLGAYSDRINDLARDSRFRSVMIFKNYRAAAGATLAHSHSQIIALPTVPKTVADEMRGALDYYQFKERCLFCDLVQQEQRDRRRVVFENAGHLVIEPYAPRFPFETWIVPKVHRSAYESCPREELAGLAEALLLTLRKLRRALDDPPYNFMFHSAPFTARDTAYYHWHIEIVPALGQIAGFEWGSGFFINPTPPEEAADFLRGLVEGP